MEILMEDQKKQLASFGISSHLIHHFSTDPKKSRLLPWKFGRFEKSEKSEKSLIVESWR